MSSDDKIFLAVLVAIVILLVWAGLSGGKSEKLHSYWYSTNCTPVDALHYLKGPWTAVSSGAKYNFYSPTIGLSPAQQTIVGSDRATGAELVNAIIRYALANGLYRKGERYMKTDSVLREALNTSNYQVDMRTVGRFGSKIMLTVSSTNGSARDIEYEYEFCFLNSRTNQSYIRLTRFIRDNLVTYNLWVKPQELILVADEDYKDSKDILIATR